jgi:hypothetical protein
MATLGIASDFHEDRRAVDLLAAGIAPLMSRGSRRWWGRRSASSSVIGDAIGTPFSPITRVLLQFGVAGAVGFGLVTTIDSLLPSATPWWI